MVSGKLPPRKIAPRSGSGFGLGLALELGLGTIFLRGNFPRPLIIYEKKILFYNISGAIHSNNISEILILFEYFRNMYPCHRRFN